MTSKLGRNVRDRVIGAVGHAVPVSTFREVEAKVCNEVWIEVWWVVGKDVWKEIENLTGRCV